MSSTIYTRIDNTVVSGSQLIANVSNATFEEFLVKNALEADASFRLVNSDANYLSYADWAVALTNPNGLGVDVSAITGASVGGIRIFSDAVDTAAYAAKMIGLFNLSSSSNPAVAKFRISGRNLTDVADVELDNGDSTHVYVNIRSADLSDSTEQTMFAASGTLGQTSTVEIFATNFTSGSEVVVFTVGPSR